MRALGESGSALLVSCESFGSRRAPLVMQLMTTVPSCGGLCWGLLYKNADESKWSKVWFSTKTLAAAWEMFDRGELQAIRPEGYNTAEKRAALNGFLLGVPAPASAVATAAVASYSSTSSSSSSSSSSASAAPSADAAYTVVPFARRFEWHRQLLIYGDLFLQAKANAILGGQGISHEETQMLAYGVTLDAYHP